MNKTEEFIAKKVIKNHQQELIKTFKKYHSTTSNLLRVFGNSKRSLSKSNAYIGLLLMDQISDYRSQQEAQYSGRSVIIQNSPRFKVFEGLAKGKDFWDSKRYPLLEFLFGERMAVFVKDAWNILPDLMYQSGFERRSFRSKELHAIHFTRQLNFIIDLIYESNCDMLFEDYIIHSNSLYCHSYSFVIAAAINRDDKEVTKLCLDAIYGRHQVAKPSGVILKGMLLSNQKECWTAIEKLLLSAQRQEGLRQSILECLDETSLGAMKHFIKLIIEHKLTRFSSVVRAIDVWAGFGWESEKEGTVRRFLELADRFLSDPTQIVSAIESDDNAEVYMALWAQGVLDVMQCPPLLDKILQGNHEKISLALYFISQVGISSSSIKYGNLYLDHSDPVIACQACSMLNDSAFVHLLKRKDKLDLFRKLDNTLENFPKKTSKSKPRVFSWLQLQYGKEIILDLMINLIDLNKEKDMNLILPHFEHLALAHREKVTRLILPDHYTYYYNAENKSTKPVSRRKRDFAFSILKDRSESIKNTAINTLSNSHLSENELVLFEDLLKRKSADFRKSVLELIVKHGEKQIIRSAENLLNAKNEEQRLAGLDLILWIKKNSKQNQKWLREQVILFSERTKITSKEELILSGLQEEASNVQEYNVDNGFGLFDPKSVIREIGFLKKTTGIYSAATKDNKYGLTQSVDQINKLLKELGELLIENKDYEYKYETWDNKNTIGLLGNVFSAFKSNMTGMNAEEKFCNYPLHHVWREWFEKSGLTKRDIFIINLCDSLLDWDYRSRTSSLNSSKAKTWFFMPNIPKVGDYHWLNPCHNILSNIEDRYPYTKASDYLADLFQYILSSFSYSNLNSYKEKKTSWNTEITTWRDEHYISQIWKKYESFKTSMDEEQFKTYWNISQYIYLTLHNKVKANYLPELYDYARAYKIQLIDRDNLMWRVMHPDAINILSDKVKANAYDILSEFEFLTELLEEARNRILEIEFVRGDSSTPVSLHAQSIQNLYGINNFVLILKALGKDTLHRGYIYTYGTHEHNKKEILSALLKRCHPLKTENQDDFNRQVKEAKLTDKRLCEAACYSPQWLPFVTNYLNWKEMESATWWLHAHTNANHDVQTESEIAKYSSVEMTAFKDGAVDVSWFKESYKALGKEKWKKLYDSAKYISDGNGHKRAMLYADVILKNTKITEIVERINKTRNQDYLRVYGLVPLSRANPEKDILRRYQFLQEFKKESKQFGAQRQASEGTAYRIALENLARTSGYPDPIRLQWAMESMEAQDILTNASDLKLDDCLIQLLIDENGKSSIAAVKNDKKLKSIPAKYRKHKQVLELKAYSKTLQEQYRRTKKSLELAMVNGDQFSKEEIIKLFNHPVVTPMLKKLVLTNDKVFGFWENGSLRSCNDQTSLVESDLRIAHCCDLYNGKVWSDYQQYFFSQKAVQPFKQVFRELYTPTTDELTEVSVSRRYDGHQIQPKKAVALLKGQHWTVDYEEGLQKVHHKENCIARMFAMADWFSPADVEAPTIETIEFVDRKKGKRIPFKDINQRTFSETMRDIDLVVSVAHVGDVDPEASQSTVELRSVIVQETCRLFKLDNVTFSNHHVKIVGSMSEYSVHLGSGVCHKMAGSSLSILPVHSQHRGRLFLPFMDDDPKTAEIVSKVLLLAKDEKIMDPSILEQIN